MLLVFWHFPGKRGAWAKHLHSKHWEFPIKHRWQKERLLEALGRFLEAN